MEQHQIAPTSKEKEEEIEPFNIPLPEPSQGSPTRPLPHRKRAKKRTKSSPSTHRPAEVESKPKMPRLQIPMPKERDPQALQPTPTAAPLSSTLEEGSPMLEMPANPQQRSTLHVSSIPLPPSRQSEEIPRPPGPSYPSQLVLHAMPDVKIRQNVLQTANTRPHYNEPRLPSSRPPSSNHPPLLASISSSLEDNKTTSLLSEDGVTYAENQCELISISSDEAEDTPYYANPVPTYQLDSSLPRASSTPSRSEQLHQNILSAFHAALSALAPGNEMRPEQNLPPHGLIHNISAQTYSSHTTASLNTLAPSSEYFGHAAVYSLHQQLIPIQESPLSLVFHSFESHSVTTTTSVVPPFLQQTTNIRHQQGYSSRQFVSGSSYSIPESTNSWTDSQADLGPVNYDSSVSPYPARFEDPNRNLQPGSTSHSGHLPLPNP